MRSIEEKLKKKKFVDSMYAVMQNGPKAGETALKEKIRTVVDDFMDIDTQTDLSEQTTQ